MSFIHCAKYFIDAALFHMTEDVTSSSSPQHFVTSLVFIFYVSDFCVLSSLTLPDYKLQEGRKQLVHISVSCATQ